VNVPARLKPGPPTKLTPTQELELWSWYQAKVALGTYKTKARELGISSKAVNNILRNMRLRQQRHESFEREKFFRELKGCPF
jgi:hypothetical protein